jgi:hypothetical protein
MSRTTHDLHRHSPRVVPRAVARVRGFLLALALAGALAELGGCTSLVARGALSPIARTQALGYPDPVVSVRPPLGLLYTNTKAPLEPAKGDVRSARTGEATTYSIGVPFLFGGAIRFAWGDSSVETARASGGISQLDYTEYRTMSIVGVFTKFTVYAHGD